MISYLEVSGDDVFYLGYRLLLGPTQLRVLKVLLAANGKPLDTYELAARCDMSGPNISHTVHAINEKAMPIGGKQQRATRPLTHQKRKHARGEPHHHAAPKKRRRG